MSTDWIGAAVDSKKVDLSKSTFSAICILTVAQVSMLELNARLAMLCKSTRAKYDRGNHLENDTQIGH